MEWNVSAAVISGNILLHVGKTGSLLAKFFIESFKFQIVDGEVNDLAYIITNVQNLKFTR